MFSDSRIDIYDYLYNLFEVVTPNVYLMSEPTELTPSDVEDGFMVIRLGNFNDEGEFGLRTYGWARVFVEAYIPPMSRGRLDDVKYKRFEDALNAAISSATEISDGDYYIQEDSLISYDDKEDTMIDNQFYVFVKSFIIVTD